MKRIWEFHNAHTGDQWIDPNDVRIIISVVNGAKNEERRVKSEERRAKSEERKDRDLDLKNREGEERE
jgi:hypothetical protein